MSQEISLELYFFLHALLTGVILSAVYDVLRIWRRVHKHGSVLIAVEDFFYWLGSALYITYVLMKENSGVIRWFFILGILIGMLIYNLTLSRYLVGYISKMINKILDIVKKILKTLLRPLLFLWKKTKVFVKFLKKGLQNIYRTIKIGISKK